jgi:hypothetical protein
MSHKDHANLPVIGRPWVVEMLFAQLQDSLFQPVFVRSEAQRT